MTNETERSKSPEPPYEYEARFIENENPSSVFVRTHRPLLDPEEVPGGVSHEIIVEYDGQRRSRGRTPDAGQYTVAEEPVGVENPDSELGDLFAEREARDPFDEAEKSLQRQNIRKALGALPDREPADPRVALRLRERAVGRSKRSATNSTSRANASTSSSSWGSKTLSGLQGAGLYAGSVGG